MDTPTHTPYVNRFIIEGNGEFNLADWQKAVSQAVEANPGIQVKLSGRWGWRVWDDEAPPPVIQVIKTNWDGMSSEGAPPEVTAPIDPRTESGVRIVAMKNVEDETNVKILISIHHGITDGMGALRFMKDIFRALNDKPCFGAKGKISDMEVKERIQSPPASILRGHCLPLVEPSSKPEVTGHRWQRIRLDGSSKKILPRVLHTFNYMAREANGDGKVLFRIPSDLRAYLDPKDPYTLSNCTGAIDLLVSSFDTVDTIEAGIAEAKKNKQDLSVFIPNFQYAAWMPDKMFVAHPKSVANHHRQGVCTFSALVSHLGKTNYASYSYDKFKTYAFYGVPTPVGEGFYVGIMSDNEGVCICIGAPKAMVDQEQLLAFSDKVKFILRAQERSENRGAAPHQATA